MFSYCSENQNPYSDTISIGWGVVRETVEHMLDMALVDTNRFSQQGGMALEIAPTSIPGDHDELHFKVAGSVIDLYIWYTGQVRELSFWSLLGGLEGQAMVATVRSHPSYIATIDAELYKSLSGWLDTAPEDHVSSASAGARVLGLYLENFVRKLKSVRPRY